MIDTKSVTSLTGLARAGRWDELDKAWLAAIESPAPPRDDLLASLEGAIKAHRKDWAETSAWAWLTQVKENAAPEDALRLARELLLRLEDGGELREEVLDLYRKTHTDAADLEEWIKRSGLAGGASVRKALRYLDVGLQLQPGAFLAHRTDEIAAEVASIDLGADSVELRTTRGTRTLAINAVIEDYRPTDADDFLVLRQLRPDRIAELVRDDPLRLVIGILRSHRGRIDRDELKIMMAPRYLEAGAWSDWWTRLRNAVKRSPHVTIEGRSPMMLVYHEAGRTLEEETRAAFDRVKEPREMIATIEGYLRDCRERKTAPDTAFLDGIQKALGERVRSASRHNPDLAFALALVIERLAAEGLPLPTDVHGLAVRMMAESDHPVALALSTPDLAIWPLTLACTQQALPADYPKVFAEVLPLAPPSQADTLARAIDDAGRGPELLPGVVDRILSDCEQYFYGLMWLWKRPELKTDLHVPPAMDLMQRIFKLVGPARAAASKKAGLNVNELRAAVRTGLSARDYAQFKAALQGQDEAMGAALRRTIERAEGLGPVVQDEMQEVIRQAFPRLFLRARVEPWDDPNVIWVTEAGRQKKEAELNELVNVKMRENAIAIGAAAEHGDLSENSEYKFALEERDLLRARLAQMNMEMSLARVLEPADISTEHVAIGHRVHLRADGVAETRAFTILGPWESDMTRHIYSYQAPIARRLLGRKPGDAVTLPDGDADREYRIESFESAI